MGIEKDYRGQQRLEAMFEEGITEDMLLKEIEPLLKDYFVSDVELNKNNVIMAFMNGQNFL